MRVIYLVMARAAAGADVPQVAFVDAALAAEHAVTATAASGVEHLVRPVTLTDRMPQRVSWHSLLVDFALDGSTLSRHEEYLERFEGHPDAVVEPTSSWRMSLRDAPSQPPSRVRVQAVGPDAAWCWAAAREQWRQAHASNEYAEAVAIEAMLTDTWLR